MPFEIASMKAPIFLLCLIASICSAEILTAAASLPEENRGIWHLFDNDFAQELELANVTSAQQLERVGYSPRRALNLFKRQNENYCFVDCPSCNCPSGNNCCTNTALKTGWCCWFTLDCETINMSCQTPTVVETVTATTTSIEMDYKTITESVGEVETTTTVISSVNIITVSDVETATITDWVTVTKTVTSAAKHRRRAVAPSKPTPPLATPTSLETEALATVSPVQKEEPDQHPILRALFPRLFQVPQKRQAITSTYTATIVTIVITSSVDVTDTVTYTDTNTETSTYSSESTSVIGASTTIHVTSTTTSGTTITLPSNELRDSSNSISSALSTTSQTGGPVNNSGGGGDDSGGLSVGAKAGIGVGSAAGALLICLTLGLLYRRRRRSWEKKIEEMSAAVNAATAAQSPPPKSEAVPVSTTPVTRPDASPPLMNSLSNHPIPLYYDHDQSPSNGAQNRYSSPLPRYDGPREMSATPIPQQYASVHGPQTPIGEQNTMRDINEMRYTPAYEMGQEHADEMQYPIAEMQHPPVEAPLMHSPRMAYGVRHDLPEFRQ